MSSLMSPGLRMLCWREWRERRMTWLLCLAWMLGFTVYSIAYIASTGFAAPVASFSTTAMLFGVVAPIFVAMRTSLGETTDRTRAFSDGLPVSRATRGAVRLLGGIAVLVVPIALGAMLYTLPLASGWLQQAEPRPIGELIVRLPQRESLPAAAAVAMLWRVTVISAADASLFYLLLAIVGTRLRSETHLGYIGAAAATLWFLLMGWATSLDSAEPTLFSFVAGSLVPHTMLVNYSYGDEAGQYGDLVLANRVWGPLVCNLLLQAALALLFVRGYAGRIANSASRAASRISLPRLWGWQPPLPTRDAALAWLTVRQTLPMCLPGLAIACVITFLELREHRPGGITQQFADGLTHSTWLIGMLWGVVVGAGVFAPDIDSRIGEFWRVLPIRFGRWFAWKYLLALAVVLLVLDGTSVAATWNSPQWGTYDSMNWPYIFLMIPLHAMIFGLAAAWTCTLRRPVIGAFAALFTYALINIALEWSPLTRDWEPIEVYNQLAFGERRVDFDAGLTRLRFQVVATGMAAMIVLSFVVAWRGLKRYDTRRLAD